MWANALRAQVRPRRNSSILDGTAFATASDSSPRRSPSRVLSYVSNIPIPLGARSSSIDESLAPKKRAHLDVTSVPVWPESKRNDR